LHLDYNLLLYALGHAPTTFFSYACFFVLGYVKILNTCTNLMGLCLL